MMEYGFFYFDLLVWSPVRKQAVTEATYEVM